MASKTNIVITGATGYVGGSVLDRLLSHPDASKFNITALVRSPEKAEKIKTLGVNVVIGSHKESDKMRKLASEADIMITIANCDDVEAAKSTLLGLKDRFEATGNKSIFIHTSGAGVFCDMYDALGRYATETIYDDMNPDQIETLPATQPHRVVDLLIVEADKQGYVDTYIIVPSDIYGTPKGRLVDLGIQHLHSLAIPAKVKGAFRRGQAFRVGEGKNIWNNVHVDDVAALYISLYDALAANPSSVGHGREGFFFGENGEYVAYDVDKAVAKALSAHGIGTDEPIPLPDQEAKQLPWFFFGTNSRTRGNRARALGWKPVHPTEDHISSIGPEVAVLLQSLREAN